MILVDLVYRVYWVSWVYLVDLICLARLFYLGKLTQLLSQKVWLPWFLWFFSLWSLIDLSHEEPKLGEATIETNLLPNWPGFLFMGFLTQKVSQGGWLLRALRFMFSGQMKEMKWVRCKI